MFTNKDEMLMKFVQGDGTSNKRVARAVLVALANFKEIIGRRRVFSFVSS